jgi:hypothetical protein
MRRDGRVSTRLACSIAARRLIMALIVLLVVSTAAAALIPVDNDPDPEPTSTPAETTQAAGQLIRKTLRVGAAAPGTIRIHAGDQLVLRVTSPVPKQVEISDLGELDDVDRDAAASFDLLISEPGTYDVRLVDSGRAVGRIVVGRRRGAQAGSSGVDSPGDRTTGLTPGALRAI